MCLLGCGVMEGADRRISIPSVVLGCRVGYYASCAPHAFKIVCRNLRGSWHPAEGAGAVWRRVVRAVGRRRSK